MVSETAVGGIKGARGRMSQVVRSYHELDLSDRADTANIATLGLETSKAETVYTASAKMIDLQSELTDTLLNTLA